MANILPILILSAVLPLSAFAHKNHHANEKGSEASIDKAVKEVDLQTLEQINLLYTRDIDPIFRKACYDCHSHHTRWPWYGRFPILKGLIQSDIEEAKEHLIMEGRFPFGGHGSPAKDLEAIAKTIDEGSMPPWRYWILHWDAKLSQEEKSKISKWILESQSLLHSSSGHTK